MKYKELDVVVVNYKNMYLISHGSKDKIFDPNLDIAETIKDATSDEWSNNIRSGKYGNLVYIIRIANDYVLGAFGIPRWGKNNNDWILVAFKVEDILGYAPDRDYYVGFFNSKYYSCSVEKGRVVKLADCYTGEDKGYTVPTEYSFGDRISTIQTEILSPSPLKLKQKINLTDLSSSSNLGLDESINTFKVGQVCKVKFNPNVEVDPTNIDGEDLSGLHNIGVIQPLYTGNNTKELFVIVKDINDRYDSFMLKPNSKEFIFEPIHSTGNVYGDVQTSSSITRNIECKMVNGIINKLPIFNKNEIFVIDHIEAKKPASYFTPSEGTLDLEEAFESNTVAKAKSRQEYAIGMAVYFYDNNELKAGVITEYDNGLYTINYSTSYFEAVHRPKVDIHDIVRPLRPGSIISFRSYKGGSRAKVENDYSLTDIYDNENIFANNELYQQQTKSNILDYFGLEEIKSEPKPQKKAINIDFSKGTLDLEEALLEELENKYYAPNYKLGKVFINKSDPTEQAIVQQFEGAQEFIIRHNSNAGDYFTTDFIIDMDEFYPSTFTGYRDIYVSAMLDRTEDKFGNTIYDICGEVRKKHIKLEDGVITFLPHSKNTKGEVQLVTQVVSPIVRHTSLEVEPGDLDLDENMSLWYNEDRFDESFSLTETYTTPDDFDQNYIKLN